MTGYAKELQKHLTTYKSQRLGVREQGIFLHKCREIRYGHILPKELKWLNILEPFRREIRDYLSANPTIRLHRYFHHLNSSQAFAFNLFLPFFQSEASPALLRALGLKGTVSKWIPELVPYPDEETNVDMSWKDTTGAWTYCEVKLSEQDFGKAAHDERHRAKLRDIYAPDLAPFCPPNFLQPAMFFANYQIFRNLWLAARDQDASVVFLLPARNEKLWEQLHKVVEGLRPSLRKRVRMPAIEQVFRNLAADQAVPPRLSWYVDLLAEKYANT